MPASARVTQVLRYAVDEANRLVIVDPDEALRPKRVVDGHFSTDADNRLLYHVETHTDPLVTAGPHAIVLDGTWALTPQHELALTLHETQRQARQRLVLKGALVQAEANALAFALRRSAEDDSRTAQRLSLSGHWRADARNRLTFAVEKADGSEDRLTLQGGWDVGRHHELLYRYRQRAVGSWADDGRWRAEQTLSFEGAWDITEADRLVYRLAGSSSSAFAFRASLQSPSLLAREGRVVYQVGVGLERGRTHRQRVTLFGAWKLNRDLSVSFEVPYADGRIRPIRFEGAAALSSRDRVAVALRTREHKPLGMSVTFTRKLIGDAELFLRLQREAEETSAIGGIQVRF